MHWKRLVSFFVCNSIIFDLSFQDLTPTKSLDKNLDITTSSIQSNQFNAGIDDQSASTPRRDDRTFKVPKTETVLKETTSKRNMPVESEEKVNIYW